VGWHGPVYVLPSSSIAPELLAADARRYVFQSDSGMEDTFRRHGTLDDWRGSVARLAVGNSRMAFALALAFAGPLVRPAGIESGGFHFRGDSSVGKTSALKVAASVWGRPTFMQRWRTTDNALEAIAAQHCDCTLILDEFGQLDPKVAGECAYMLANEQEKGRATRGAMLRKRRTWRLLFLSSGEVSLSDHMAEAGKRTRAGMEVRMLDIPLDAGQGMGGLEVLHGMDGPGALADALVGDAARFYGTAGRAWLEWCCDHHGELPELLQGLVERYRDDLVPEAAAEQVRRAGTRFALVAAAGELATRAGVTGWPEGEAMQAVRQCFNAWLGARGHMENGEESAMLRQVRQFLEANGEGRFAWWHRALDDHTPKTLNRAGFRRLLGDDGKPVKSDADHQREYGERMSAADAELTRVDFIVLREVFEREVCRGFDPKAVARLLQRRGHLVTEAPDRLLDRQRIPGMGKDKAPCYHILPSIFTDEL
jgi:putative DNA primase/helicase